MSENYNVQQAQGYSIGRYLFGEMPGFKLWYPMQIYIYISNVSFRYFFAAMQVYNHTDINIFARFACNIDVFNEGARTNLWISAQRT